MAIEIKTTPGSYCSAHEDLIFVVYEATKATNPGTYTDYKYVANIYVGAERVATIKRVPRPDNKMGVFNIGNIVRNYVSAVFNPEPLALRPQQLGLNEFYVDVTVKFGEEYGYSLYENLVADSQRRYYNHYNGRMPGQQTVLGGYADKVISKRPYATPVQTDDTFCFLPYFPTSGGAINLLVKSYTETGNILNTISTTFTPAAYTLQLINIAPAVLSNYATGFLDGAAYYTVKINNSEYRLNLVCETRYTNYAIHFLNKFGGFESRNFNKLSRKNIAITKTGYGRLSYDIGTDGSVNYYNANGVYNQTNSVYASQFTEKLTLNSDILTDEEYTWLAQLVASPMVYLQQGEYFLPCTISDNNYELRQTLNDKLTNLTLNIEFGETFNTQYR
ncbi:hypothetical protein [Mucilaginibacter pedocola]|uniref:Uncharacterized protein n=1 Tax=Mucilaginibacter pedocola TaxID=1792845 RepID=A0A1S9P860_9SPHI|nr:hypothetical protein [Mucilaginibacter pedocola]OOQ57150.1 hypothetical protein BC343_16655 [Mucilaginibacter pedocola]